MGPARWNQASIHGSMHRSGQTGLAEEPVGLGFLVTGERSPVRRV